MAVPVAVWLDEATRARLRAGLAGCVDRARSARRIQWLALRRVETVAEGASPPDPLLLFRRWRGVERCFWQRPAEAFGWAARGVLHTIEATGSDRFAESSRRAEALFADLVVVGDEAPADEGPFLVGGFAFDAETPAALVSARELEEWRDFPDGRLVLPEQLVVVRERRIIHSWVHAVVPGARLEAEWDSLLSEFSQPHAAPLSEATDTEGAPEAASGAGESSDELLAAPYDLGPEYRVRADRSHARFRAQVGAALDCIAAGELDKVVLARSLRVRHDGRFELEGFLDRLRRIYPSCVTFATDRVRSAFVGATPERLVALRGGEVATTALAGSAPRGRTPEADAELGRALQASTKEQLEHALVVRAIREALAPLCGSLRFPERPRLLQVEGIQHLETPLTGALREGLDKGVGVLDLVACLHPTPAVGGVPRAPAMRWIREHEGLVRGWYAGPVGFVDAEGGGEFRVALRSGLLAGGEARLFAGVGLVAGSQPEDELAETRLKLRALLAPLTEI